MSTGGGGDDNGDHHDDVWASKLRTKLRGLTATSSKESWQTVAAWMAFNRKHATSFVTVLSNEMMQQQQPNIYLPLLHEIMLLEHGHGIKWDRLQALRHAVGEHVLLPYLDNHHNVPSSSNEIKDKLVTYFKEWDRVHALGGSTLLSQMRKKLATAAAPSSPAVEATAAAASPAGPQDAALNNNAPSMNEPEIAVAAPPNVDPRKQSPPKTPPPPPQQPLATAMTPVKSMDRESTGGLSDILETATTTTTTSMHSRKRKEHPSMPRHSSTTELLPSSSTSPTIPYDFSHTTVAPAPVAPKDLLEPCRQLAQLQIARDLRSDAVVQLSSLLSSLPADIIQHAAAAASADNNDNAAGLDDDSMMARDYAARVPATLLDMDVAEQLSNVRTFRRIVAQQRTARQQLLTLLLQSRCCCSLVPRKRRGRSNTSIVIMMTTMIMVPAAKPKLPPGKKCCAIPWTWKVSRRPSWRRWNSKPCRP